LITTGGDIIGFHFLYLERQRVLKITTSSHLILYSRHEQMVTINYQEFSAGKEMLGSVWNTVG